MKVSKILFKVIVIELFLMLSFSAMACHLYFDFEAFQDLPTSFLSLFESKQHQKKNSYGHLEFIYL
jgi:hypothetical protein